MGSNSNQIRKLTKYGVLPDISQTETHIWQWSSMVAIQTCSIV